jgi:carboxymethylenebutenolidase
MAGGAPQQAAARGRFVTVPAADGGSFRAYLALPPRTPAPGIVMQHTMFGVNDQFRGFCHAYAAEGFVVIAPDLFWRIEPGIELDYAEESYEKGHGYIKIFDKDKGVEDVEATRRFLLALPEHRGKVAAVGYCLGGTLAYLVAARTPIDMAVSYYAIDMEAHFGEIERIRAPMVVHLGTRDAYVKPGAFELIRRTLATRPNFEFHAYAGADHGFARENSKLYDAAAAKLAWARTMAALRRTIGP